MLAPHRDDHIFEYKEGQWQASSRAGVGRTRPPSHHAKDRHEETCTLGGDIGSSHIRELEDLLVPRTIMPRIPKVAVTHRLANGWWCASCMDVKLVTFVTLRKWACCSQSFFRRLFWAMEIEVEIGSWLLISSKSLGSEIYNRTNTWLGTTYVSRRPHPPAQ